MASRSYERSPRSRGGEQGTAGMPSGTGSPGGRNGGGWKSILVLVLLIAVVWSVVTSIGSLFTFDHTSSLRPSPIGGTMLFTIILLVVVIAVVLNTAYVVRQQHVVIIERLGRFHKISSPGFHVRVPFFDRIAEDVDLMTEDEHMTFDAKTSDNVTIELDVSAQYRVDATYPAPGASVAGNRPTSSPAPVMPGAPVADGSGAPAGVDMGGIYKSHYMLATPVAQMKDYLADALRSQIPNRTLDEVFSEKDAIAQSIDEVVAAKMKAYGYILVTTLITSIRLPAEVQESMNHIVASKNNLASAQNDANAQKVKVVTAAQAKAEAMAAEGKGIADQRANIAEGIARSLGTIEASGVSTDEANRLFQFTQWCDMMSSYAATGASTVVLPSDFRENASMFEQMMAAQRSSQGDGKAKG